MTSILLENNSVQCEFKLYATTNAKWIYSSLKISIMPSIFEIVIFQAKLAKYFVSKKKKNYFLVSTMWLYCIMSIAQIYI